MIIKPPESDEPDHAQSIPGRMYDRYDLEGPPLLGVLALLWIIGWSVYGLTVWLS